MEKQTEMLVIRGLGVNDGTTTSAKINLWHSPTLIETNEVGESIEMIYKEVSLISKNNIKEERVFKIIFSCIDGKWNKSERIYGEIVPPTNEYYNFDN
jgi:hypothetical protein